MRKLLSAVALFIAALCSVLPAMAQTTHPDTARKKPLVAVVGHNDGTVLADFAIPYGVLSQSGLAEVVSVATKPGLLKLGPVRVRPDHTLGEFDARFPQGADYVIVPAVSAHQSPALVAWVASQASKGATMVSICNGSLVLAEAGVTRGHRVTGHWSTHSMRVKNYPHTQWIRNARYVIDGKVISSAGVTAALPTSIALVEALGGAERAAEMAHWLGLRDWGTKHDSDAFEIRWTDYAVGASNSFLRRVESIGIPVTEGVDEIALALVAEAYSNTLRNEVHVVAQATGEVRSRGGLRIIPDRVSGPHEVDILLAPIAMPAGQAADKVLEDIAGRYGRRTARLVVLDWEYHWPGL